MNAATAVVVLAFHGGAFTGGDPADVQPVVDGLRAQGIEAKAVRYPLGRGMDAAYRDMLRQVRHHERRGRRVMVYGHSAGASMALWLSATRRVPAVAMNPVTDFVSWRIGPSLAGWRARTVRSLGPVAVQRRLSPFHRLTRRSGPATIIHSRHDSIVPYRQSEKYRARARRLGVRVRLVTTRTDHFPDVSRAVAAVLRLSRLTE